MAKIDKETVKKIANLAVIEVNDQEAEKYATQLSSILEYVEIIKEIENENVDFKSHIDLKNVMREDVAENSLDQSAAVGQGKNEDGYIVVPNVI